MCSLLCNFNFNCYCTLGASLMLALSAIDVSLHYYYMQNFHRKKNVPLSIANWVLKVHKGVEIELRNISVSSE